MTRDLPLWLKLALVAELGLSVLAAAVGRAPRRPVRVALRRALVMGAVCVAIGAGIARLQEVPAGEKLLLFLAVELMCAWAWFRRAPRREDGGGGDDGGGGGPEPPVVPPPGYDWNDFDRARRDWERPRVGS